MTHCSLRRPGRYSAFAQQCAEPSRFFSSAASSTRQGIGPSSTSCPTAMQAKVTLHTGAGPQPAILTTEHAMSSCGLPVLLVDDEPHGPGDLPPDHRAPPDLPDTRRSGKGSSGPLPADDSGFCGVAVANSRIGQPRPRVQAGRTSQPYPVDSPPGRTDCVATRKAGTCDRQRRWQAGQRSRPPPKLRHPLGGAGEAGDPPAIDTRTTWRQLRADTRRVKPATLQLLIRHASI